MNEKELPRWDMTNIYPRIDSDEFEADQQKLEQWIDELDEFFEKQNIGPGIEPLEDDSQTIGAVCATFLEKLNAASILFSTMYGFVYAYVDTDTYNEIAKKKLSELQSVLVKFNHLENVLFKGWLGTLANRLPEIIESEPVNKVHAFYLTEAADQSKYLMSAAEEKLAGELSLSGSLAWFELSEEVKSQLKWHVKNEQDNEEELPITAIINLFDHPAEKMRRRGYDASLEAFASVENILAAALNGVKGTQLVEFNHRDREDALHDSLDKSRIDRETLDAMLETVKAALPMLREFYLIKAKRLGKETLPFWDLNAPTAKATTKYSYQQAQNLILENFSKFSGELAGIARKAFDNNWIDVGPREGKVGGAYCMGLPGVEESRILLNYEGNLNWLFALAHELGHAFHNHCLRGKTRFHRQLPMTLAETASIMCETIVTNAAIEQAKTDDEELAILEASLNSALIVIVDIYAAYLYENEVFKRRAEGKLSAKEFNDIDEWTQAEAYGKALDENYRFKYTWARWPHLFLYDLSFYNYPYTFGLLLGIGLYAVYQERGNDFIPQYMEFLSSTGMGTAADLAAKFDMDLRDPGFWQRGLDVIVQRIERYSSLAG
jgi:pepF/M3 family oligoendopeptidase